MTIKNVGVLSVAKMLGLLYALMGLLIGGLFTLVGMLGVSAMPEMGPFAIVFGVGSIIFFPLAYGTIGFVGGMILAALYNLIANLFGGIELEVS